MSDPTVLHYSVAHFPPQQKEHLESGWAYHTFFEHEHKVLAPFSVHNLSCPALPHLAQAEIFIAANAFDVVPAVDHLQGGLMVQVCPAAYGVREGAFQLKIEQQAYHPAIQPAKTEQLLALYAFDREREKTEVTTFVLRHEHVIEPLIEAHTHIRHVFGDDVSVSLEIYRDPQEEFEGLFIIVKTDLSTDESVDESITLLNKFYDHEWWLSIDRATSRLVGVDLESK